MNGDWLGAFVTFRESVSRVRAAKQKAIAAAGS